MNCWPPQFVILEDTQISFRNKLLLDQNLFQVTFLVLALLFDLIINTNLNIIHTCYKKRIKNCSTMLISLART